MLNDIQEFYKTLTILCVEDDEFVAESYKDMFSLMFKEVHIASDGLEGLRCFDENHIDIILSDYKMPFCNGLEMSRKIRKKDPTIPIIIVTALEDLDMLRSLIEINITGFLKKPFTIESMEATFSLAVKSIIADRLLIQEQMKKLLYSDYQEQLTYAKEKRIIKNELDACSNISKYTCKVFYKPKDTLSGDSYLIKNILHDRVFIMIVDGMGKGVSASVTAMMCSAFVNYTVDKLREESSFSLENILKALLEFLRPNLLEDEVVSAHFIDIDMGCETMRYATFSMPPLLYKMNDDEEVKKLRSNNPPLAEYTQEFSISEFSMKNVEKMIIYSDGLNENTLNDKDELYTQVLANDFKEACDLETLEELRLAKVGPQEDDITYILLVDKYAKV